MPNALRNWPNACDPRTAEGGACFCCAGFWGCYPAAWRYRVVIENAPPPYDVWNGKHFLDFRDCIDTPFLQCAWELLYPPLRAIRLYKWWVEPLADPPAWDWGLELEDLGALPPYSFGNGQGVVEPKPSDNLPPFTMVAHVPTWVTPLLVRPRIWNATE